MRGEPGHTARARRTVGDCGASPDEPNGSFMPEAVGRRVCEAGMLNTAGMLFVFTNTTMRTHTRGYLQTHTDDDSDPDVHGP